MTHGDLTAEDEREEVYPNVVTLTQAEWDERQHQLLHEHYCAAHVCPVCGVEDPHQPATASAAAPAASPEAWRCEAILYHGPGHQSRAQCERTDEHPLSGEHYAGRTYRFQWEGPGDQPATATAAATSEEDR